MTELYLIRHGESLGNAKRIFLGHADWDLSTLGYLQAEETARELASVRFDALYSSDLIRALHTAAPHAARHGLELIPCSDLRELFVGDWEEAAMDSLLGDERYTVGWRHEFGTFTFPNGEDVYLGSERITRALRSIAERHEGERVLVVFHAAAIRSFWCRTLGLSREAWAASVPFPANASYSVVRYEGGRFIPVEYSHAAHLSEVHEAQSGG